MGLLDLLLPRTCLGCSRPGALVCERCLFAVERLDGPACRRCGAPTAFPVARCRECAGRRLAFADARAAIAYDRTTRALVRGWKERGLRGIARLAGQFVVEVVEPPAAAAVTWVPAVRDRLLERGHSTAHQLALELGAHWQLEPLQLLERTRFAAAQRGQDLRGRRANVAGAFRARGRPPPRVCLVDDVYTTGATVSAAAGALRRAGARHVHVVTLARTLRQLD